MLNKASQQFEFINLSNKPQITDAGARKLVRAHAMRDFRRRKVPREPCDNQGFVQKSSLDIARAIKPLESHHPRGELSDEEVKRGSSDDQVGDSPLLAGAPTWSEDGQDSPPQQGDGPKQIKAATVKPSRNSARQAKKQSKRSQMGRQLSSPTTSSSSDSDFPQSPQTSQAQNGKRSDGFEMIARSPGAWSADPFDALPIPSTERVRILMHHCKQGVLSFRFYPFLCNYKQLYS